MTLLAWVFAGLWVVTMLWGAVENARWRAVLRTVAEEAIKLNTRWHLVAEVTALRAAKNASLGTQSWSVEDQLQLNASIQALKDTGISLTELGIEDEPLPKLERTEVN